MLRVRVPAGHDRERAYAVDVVLAEFLGLEYRLEPQERHDVEIAGADDAVRVTMPDAFFPAAGAQWLRPESVPTAPAPRRRLPAALTWPGGPRDLAVPFPAVAGDGLYREDGDLSRLEVDVFGTAFFMLTRYEEVAAPAHDAHERYPAAASLAGRSGLLERPIVCEQIEALWRVVARRWPRLRRRPRAFRPIVTHDVDWPFCVLGQPPRQVVRQIAGDVARRRDPVLAVGRSLSVPRTRLRGARGDLCNTFDWIMSRSEGHGLRSAFYFIPGRTGGAIDGGYRVGAPAVRAVIGAIAARGHEVGIHPSYNTFRDRAALEREFAVLREVARQAGVDQSQWGGRQHYLRWEAPTTWQAWADAGLAYDSSVGYAEAPGFRAGVCWEYPAFNLRSRERLRLIERPLVVMEASLPRSPLTARVPAEGMRRVEELAAQCRLYAGDFVLLWHNNNLVRHVDRRLYAQVLRRLESA